MTEAANLYRGACRLLTLAKAHGWKITRTPAGQWTRPVIDRTRSRRCR